METRTWLLVGSGVATALSVAAFGHAPVSWMLAVATVLVALVAYRDDRHAQAVTLAVVALVQTLVSSFGEWNQPWVVISAVLSLLTIAVVLIRQMPVLAVWAVLVLAAAQFMWYVSRFENLFGGLLYSIVLFPFALRLASLAVELFARRTGDRAKTDNRRVVVAQ
jgi:hypothetical protein